MKHFKQGNKFAKQITEKSLMIIEQGTIRTTNIDSVALYQWQESTPEEVLKALETAQRIQRIQYFGINEAMNVPTDELLNKL